MHIALLGTGLAASKTSGLALYTIAGLFAASAYLMVATNSLVMAVFTLAASLGGVAAIKLAFRAGEARRAEAAAFDAAQRRV